ncbi:MAG: helix-turn-helix domain-containing protein [Marinibacterium sp.]
MATDATTGSRIRERRSMAGMKQADLARRIGISASYLNLIEHNRRRIGGKLVVDIAQVLGVEPSMLTEGAEATLIATLREAAAAFVADAGAGSGAEEIDRADEFAGRFPVWAEVLARAHRRIGSLEQTVETLSDRLGHDPHLAASLHDLLSTAAAIRSTASILAERRDLETEWRDRFHRNLDEDSLRLAEGSKALADYLDESGAADDRRGVPQEEVEAVLSARGHHFPELEDGRIAAADLVAEIPALGTSAARAMATSVLEQYARDARAMPLAAMETALGEHGCDPLALARTFGGDPATAMRRIAAMPPTILPEPVGLVICDASGALIFRKLLDGFAVPRFGASCPLWPLFSALSRPLTPLRRYLTQDGRGGAVFEACAIAGPAGPPEFNRAPLLRSTMLVRRVRSPDTGSDAPDPVGSTCRICPRNGCLARREPSILREGF